MKQIKLVTNNISTNFYQEIKNSLQNCEAFYFSVAFITHAATQMILRELQHTQNRQVKGKIVTTDYMLGTDHKALEILKEFNNIETRIFLSHQNENKGFHTKGYIFEYADHYQIYIGSSNLSKPALVSNQEWNVSYVSKSKNNEMVSSVLHEFHQLWNNQSIPLTIDFINHYRNQKNEKSFFQSNLIDIFKALSLNINQEEIKQIAHATNRPEDEIREILSEITKPKIIPNEMQQNALESLYHLRQKGENKALVIAATASGKTFMSAFDVLQVNPKRLLFLVHNETVLKTAKESFERIIPLKSMGLYTGNTEQPDEDYIFATVQKISRKNNLIKFPKDHFDYIIIDEAHHIAASTYQTIINHFTPDFLLGMTATDTRTDSHEIYSYFDHNIAAEVRLSDAISKEMIVPFHYFGITDLTTNLEGINLNKEIDSLAKILSISARVELIIEEINNYKSSGTKIQALGFCINISHANYMANEFNRRGYSSIALTGETSQINRTIALKRLKDESDDLSFIFAVDILNEGIDIPSLNLVLFLRPTQSPIIFTQQLGRGLRKYPGKEFLTVLDFIGNHNKTFMIPLALFGNMSYDKNELITAVRNDFLNTEGDVFIRIDEIAKKQILSQLEQENLNGLKYLQEIYSDVKHANPQQRLSISHFDLKTIDPVRFITKSKTFYQFAKLVDNDYKNIILTPKMEAILRYLDMQLPLIRPHEFLILKLILEHNSTNSLIITERLTQYLKKTSIVDINHAVRNLQLDFADAGERKRSPHLIEQHDKIITFSKVFSHLLDNDDFKQLVTETITYGLSRYLNNHYDYQVLDHNLRLYEKYAMRDIGIMTNYEKTTSSVRGAGLWESNGEYFLFVDLHKKNVHDSIDYNDQFITPSKFIWESPNTTTLDSKRGRDLTNQSSQKNIHLFARKQQRENGVTLGYYYLGKVIPISHKNEKPIQITYQLEQTVPENIYLLMTEVYNIEKN